MSDHQPHQPHQPPQIKPPPDAPGLFAGLSGVGRNLLGLIVSRYELATLELSSVGINLAKVVLAAVIAIFMALFAIAFWSTLIVYLSWDALGWKILLIMAAIFTAATVALGLYARSIVSAGKLSMPATLAELSRDRDALF